MLPQLKDAQIYMSEAIWQIKLDAKSKELTCFNTPFGRYQWDRLPFILSSEMFQNRLHTALEGLKGLICIADEEKSFSNKLSPPG